MNQPERRAHIRISCGSINGFPLVAVGGECDAFTAPFTHGAVSALIDAGHTGIIIDISDLSYMDGAGFEALDRCCTKMKAVDGMLLIVNPGENIENIYELLREKDSCDIERSVEDALARLIGARRRE